MGWVLLLGCARVETTDGVAETVEEDGGDPVVVLPPEEDFPYGAETLDFTLTLDEEAIDGLATYADEDVPDVRATFRWQDEEHQVGLRLRGGNGSFREFDDKPGFLLDFAGFEEGGRFHGIRYMTLKNMVQDDSMLREHVTYQLYRDIGVPAPRHNFARVVVNDEPFGLYGIIETVTDPGFLQHAFGVDDGLLFEGQMDDFVAGTLDSFDVLQDGGLWDPHAALGSVVDALDAASPDGCLAAFEAHFDASLLDALAMELVTGNPDGYVTWTNNYYLYRTDADAPFAFIPWGPDQAFAEDLWLHADYPGRLHDDCRASAECAEALDARHRALAERLASASFGAWLDEAVERTQLDCEEDPRSPDGADGCREGREDLLEFIAERPAQVEEMLE